MIDTILVFARARTSALHPMISHDICSTLIARFNQILHASNASFPRAESIFVTCKRSPRFNWSTHVTHRKLVGISTSLWLGMSFYVRPSTRFCIDRRIYLIQFMRYLTSLYYWSIFVQKRSWTDIWNLIKFYNDTMTSLGLPFWTWVFRTDKNSWYRRKGYCSVQNSVYVLQADLKSSFLKNAKTALHPVPQRQHFTSNLH